MKCKICQQKSKLLFSTKLLNKYQVKYYRCPNCEFIQTEEPYWLKEAYQHAITDLDIGLVYRNLEYSGTIFKVITTSLDYSKTFLDYAGGYGLFVRIMRDKGLNFYHHDKYCENIFAKNHGLENLKIKNNFEAITALEVFEHLNDPIKEIKIMSSFADNIIFSTEIIPNNNIKTPDDWWYFVPETGQHIAFYSKKTLEYISKLLGLNYYNQDYLHIFSRKKFNQNPFDIKKKTIKLHSLLNQDFLLAKSISTNKVKNTSDYNVHNHDQDQRLNDLIELFAKIKLQKLKIKKLQLQLTTQQQRSKQIQDNLDKSIEINKQSQLSLSIIKKEKITLTNTLHAIYKSNAWRLMRKYYIIRDKLVSNKKVKK